jgi:hypothetical protein
MQVRSGLTHGALQPQFTTPAPRPHPTAALPTVAPLVWPADVTLQGLDDRVVQAQLAALLGETAANGIRARPAALDWHGHSGGVSPAPADEDDGQEDIRTVQLALDAAATAPRRLHVAIVAPTAPGAFVLVTADPTFVLSPSAAAAGVAVPVRYTAVGGKADDADGEARGLLVVREGGHVILQVRGRCAPARIRDSR